MSTVGVRQSGWILLGHAVTGSAGGSGLTGRLAVTDGIRVGLGGPGGLSQESESLRLWAAVAGVTVTVTRDAED